MTMTGSKVSKTLLAVMLTSAVATGSIYTENATMDKTQSGIESVGQKIGNSMNKVGGFMGDSTIAIKVEAVPMDHGSIKSTDISVKTDQKMVVLSGLIGSQVQAGEAVKVTKGVEGVIFINDKLHVRNSKETSVKDHASDAAIASKIKARLLADDTTPSRKMKVETTGDAVQLSGTVNSQAQGDHAESIAKVTNGVRDAKNDLKTQ